MTVVAGSSEVLGGRFQLVRRIGEGGFGVVFEAVDHKFGGPVAIKMLRHERAAEAARFKREFRGLVDVQHRNLVQLFELGASDERLYFTMELVDGIDFLAHVSSQRAGQSATAEWPPSAPERRDHTVSLERLHTSLVQLVEAVQALHDARKLHCDVKPSNVLVTAQGRVVLLDFGMIADLDRTTRSTLGTPGYMAPEQLAGDELSEATDWYGVGAMLHEVITGALPRVGRRCETEVPALRPLAALCDELLDPDPTRRPKSGDILARLGVRGPRAPRTGARLIGRDVELTRLRDAWRGVRDLGEARLVRVTGASGIGKSALVEHALRELAADGAQVLTGRCYEQESVPYKALDGAIDALADLLAGAPAAIPPEAGVLARLFPVLRPLVGDDSAGGELDSQATRRRAFAMLRELLARLSQERPLVLFVDDLQWGDADSAHLLTELVRPPGAARLLVVVTYRPTSAGQGFLATLDEHPLGIPDERIELPELSEPDALALAEYLVGGRSPDVERISREAAGNPLFIHQLATASHERVFAGLSEVILAHLSELDADARRLVQAIALSAGPIDEATAIAAAKIDAADARAAARTVRQARLVTARHAGDGVTLEPVHDRIREVVAAALSEPAASAQHRSLADALLAQPKPDPDAVVYHLHRAGDRERARVHALVAAERAEHALAFDRAAAHLQLILELGGGARGPLLERLGEALANAGRGGDAAEAFQAAADELGDAPDAARELRRRAGELTLRSGRIALGWERMVRVLDAVGVRPPRGRRSASAIGVVRRLRLFAHGLPPRMRPHAADPGGKARLEALWSASTGMSMVDHVVADALGLQHMLEALALGERSHVIRGLGYEAAFEAVIGGRYLRKRCARILDAMDGLAAASADPYDLAWARMSKGVTAWFLGDWPTSWRDCSAAAEMYRERCRGVAWELAICDAYRLPALAYRGELAELARVVPLAYAGARERGDLYAMNLLSLGQQSVPRLAENRPEAAIDEADAAVAPFPRDTYILPHYHHLFAVVQAELYRDQPEAAARALAQAWPGLERARLLMVQCLRCEIRHLHARVAIATAARAHDPTPHRATARKEATRIERDDVAPAKPLAAAIRAALAEGADDKRHELERAVVGFEAAHMQLYAHACRDRLGALVGGSAGREERAAAAAWFATQQVANPERMIAMLLPGV